MTGRPITILCVTEYYLPGFKGGGPIRTIANMRKLLAGEAEIAIFTRDRDLGSDIPYEGIRANEWLNTEFGAIFYADPTVFNAPGLKRAVAAKRFEILYLNSFFGYRSSIQPYFAFRRVRDGFRILIAPRGEFSEGALSIKRSKKRMFLALINALGLYRDVHWHASSAVEEQDILRRFPRAAGTIYVAEDPIELVRDRKPDCDFPRKRAGVLRLAFISRISPMKNLDGLLRMLASVSSCVELEIFGPIEKEKYWEKCRALIAALPDHVTATYQGPLEPEKVSAVFAGFDLFAFPTHGENFGHVIFESLRAGTPVLVSDQTPWRTDPAGAITAVPLVDQYNWRREIDLAAKRTDQQQQQLRAATLDLARNYAAKRDTLVNNVNMFRTVANCSR